ncbi:MAG: hypothetical protein V4721_16435 [Bacteroidota bacterium]
MIFFNPTAKAEIRVICPHCTMINEIDIQFVSSDDKPKEYPQKCKRCLNKFLLVLSLTVMFHVKKDEE